MDADRVIVALVAASALLAFGVAAANLVGVTDERQPPNVENASDRQQGEPPGPPQPTGDCLVGCGGARSVLAALVGGLTTRTVLIVGGVAGVLVLGAWALWGRGEEGDVDAMPVDPTGGPPASAPSRSGQVSAADAPPTNEVFRAWRELADSLAVGEGEAITPAEYAAEARSRGYDPAAVEALTDVFREVRYGTEDPTADREEQARRAIESLGSGDDE